MDGIHAVTTGGVEYALDMQIAFGGGGGADVGGFVGFAYVKGGAIGVGVGHGSDAHLAQGADDAQSDLAAVGDQNFLEHTGV